MSFRVVGITALGTVLLGACNQPPNPNPIGNPHTPTLVQVSSIANVVKCELNYTFTHYPNLMQLIAVEAPKTPTIKGTLHLQNVIVTSDSGTVGFKVPVLNDSGGSGTYTNKNTNTQTVDLKFDLAIDPRKPAPAQCVAGPERVGIVGHPFVVLLQGIGAEYAKIDTGSPTINLGELDYNSQFDVERDASGNLKLDFVIFTAEGTHEQNRTSTQSLELDFTLTGLGPRFQTQ